MQIFQTYFELHSQGYHHGKFEVDRVLLSSDRTPVLIHLGSIQQVRCKHRAKQVRFGDIAPELRAVGCSEIRDICLRLGVWKPRQYDALFYWTHD